MTTDLRLHYAPDNASLCVRLALEALNIPYQTTLVDRASKGQRDPAYLALNPNGLIPVLETPHGALFETGAILLWLADSQPGTLMPAPDDPARGPALTWHFWLANTLHPTLRMLFYPDAYHPDDTDGLRRRTRVRLTKQLAILEAAHPAFLSDPDATAQGCYLAPMLRWMAIYGGDTGWFDLSATPRIADFARAFEMHGCTRISAQKEGLGPTPISKPSQAQPPEGTAL